MSADLEAVIVGTGEAKMPPTRRRSPLELMGEAARNALASAGLELSDVDGLAVASVDHYMPTISLAEHLGVRPTFVDSTSLGGCSFYAQIEHAVDAMAAQRCSVVLVVFGSTIRSDPPEAFRLSEPSPYEWPYGAMYPLSGFALMAAAHIHRYGTRPEDLARVAVSARSWAALAPGADRPDPITVDEVLESPLISSPLRRLDCCLVSDGGIAVVLTTQARARDLDARPIRIAGTATAQSHRYISGMPDLTVTPGVHSGAAAMRRAGVKPADIDVLQLYDATTLCVPLSLEDLGFCAKGDGGDFFRETCLGPGAVLPVNTNGAGLAYRHPGMLGLYLLAEAVAQLNGSAGARTVTDAEVALVHALGGPFSATATMILTVDDW